METPQEYISGLADRYINGEVSKSMFNKYIECTMNVVENKMVKLTGDDAIIFAISIGVTLVSSFTKIANHKRKIKTPNFESGGIISGAETGEEMIINSKGNCIAPNPPIINGKIISFRCGHCGRVLKQKTPHKCNTGYRKRNHNFIPMY